jgi:hypothetical protein
MNIPSSSRATRAGSPVARPEIIDAVQSVFLVAAPLAALALLVVLALPEAPLRRAQQG